ncbi:AglZ/HisF2 family acetamidino modification protein [Candidatus Pelagibacter sp.]|nr:AglZ/HisF2 family acetamidino modification protein [Candidatus Pelagibacter sp.]
MISPRIIPSLLIKDNALVKTKKFLDPKYVGDPLNAVKIFNELKVDELLVLDIDATTKGLNPNEKLISKLAEECRMPLCYGGGVKTVEQFEKLVSLGVEKVAISSVAIENPKIINEAAKKVGSQSVVVVLDIKYQGILSKPKITTLNGSNLIDLDLLEFVKKIEDLGAGEIVINCIDKDGMKSGYDIELISNIRANSKIMLTLLGGAGSYNDIEELVTKVDTIGCSAGSLFIFKGKFDAVLISYLDEYEKEKLKKIKFL